MPIPEVDSRNRLLQFLQGALKKLNSLTIGNYKFPTSDGTANQVLTTDGAGTLTFQTNANGNVASTGTPADNQVAIWTDSSTIEGDTDLTFDGSNLTIGGDVTVGGYLEIAKGIKNNPSVLVAPFTLSTNQWVKVAATQGTLANADTTFASFLVTFVGTETAVTVDGDFAYIINVKFTANNSSPYYWALGTYVTVDPLHAGNLENFDPTNDVAITFDNTTLPTSVELWVRSKENYKNCFVSYLGGTNNPDGDAHDTGFEILTGQSFASSITSLGQEIYGQYVDKIFNDLTLDSLTTSAANFILDASGDITLDADGSQIYFNDGGSTKLTFNLDATPELDVTGDFTVDCSGDITLDADGSQVYFKDNGALRLTFNLDSTPELDVNGAFTIDCSSNITLDADGGTITFADAGNSLGTITSTGTSIGGASKSTGQRVEFLEGNGGTYDSFNGAYWESTNASNTNANTVLEASNQQYDMLGPAWSGTVLYHYAVKATPASTPGNVVRATDSSTANNFTGQHNVSPANPALLENLEDNVGLIVVANGNFKRYDERPAVDAWVTGKEAITIAEALPIVELATLPNDKRAFGVISNRPNEYLVDMDTGEYEEDQDGIAKGFGNIKNEQVRINSIGEGAIWVCNISGNLENGDYITTCEIPGLGMKQGDDLLHNYTVAKITQDCDFRINAASYNVVEFEFGGSTYRKAFVGCTYHCG